jgi:hypothetical protein
MRRAASAQLRRAHLLLVPLGRALLLKLRPDSRLDGDRNCAERGLLDDATVFHGALKTPQAGFSSPVGAAGGIE